MLAGITGIRYLVRTARLADLIGQDVVTVPLPLHAVYRERHIEATLEAPGVIRLGDSVFASPSAAASAARKLFGYRGAGDAATNGWDFWRFRDADGRLKPLWALRERLS